MSELSVFITPTRASLLKRTGPVPCPEKDCTTIFESESHLNMHLAKTHGMDHKLKKQSFKQQLFRCPEKDCTYNKTLYFKQMKLLKQHYLKVHAEKCHICELCGKGFSFESALKYHEEYCGIVFKCTACNTSYPCYESLQTHCRRKKHSLFPKSAYKTVHPQEVKRLTASKSDSDICRKPRLLLPKSSDTYLVLIASKQAGLDKSSQTEDRSSIIEQICVESQTIGDFIPVKRTNSNSEKISIETQTKDISSQTKSCNTTEQFNMEDCIYEDVAVEQKNSSTQTNRNNPLCNEGLMDFDDTSFFNCNSETQTDLFSDALLNNCDFYSNMCTQTPSCEDMLLNDLEFNDTYTQTAYYDAVRSVESQTMLYNNYKKGLLLCRDVANIETQTDLEVKQILEEMG